MADDKNTEKKQTIGEKINFSGKGKTKQRKKQRDSQWTEIAKKLGF